MDQISYQHEDLANGRWAELSFAEQMGNVGSEISRAVRWQSKGKHERVEQCVFRALELLDLTINATDKNAFPKLKELCRAREELCDFFLGDNELQSKPEQIMKYYDAFALAARCRQHNEASLS